MFVGLQKTSLVNFPGRVAATVFLPGCNMRCPYCYNKELTTASPKTGIIPNSDTGCQTENLYVPLKDVFALLEKRKSVISGLAISGGEPCLSPARFELIKSARKFNLAVKIDTNGMFPECLQELFAKAELCPDMVALDVKTSPARYPELFSPSSAGIHAEQKLLQTITLLTNTKKHARTLYVEYRTVLVPGLVDKKDIKNIAAILPKNADWKFANFQPGNCLDPHYNTLRTYSLSKIQTLIQYAQKFIPNASLR